MYNNRAKLSGFRRMNLKDVVSAMTTSPVEGQIGESRKTGVNAATQLTDSMKKIVGRADRNLRDMDSEAHQELASVNMASRSPTSPYLIRRGEYLVCRCHDERIPLKSAQTTQKTWITWDNSCVDKSHYDDPLFEEITKVLRVSHLTLSRDENGAWFVKCDCGGRENIGIPCGCFFRIAENAGVPQKDIVDLCMVSPKYMKVFQTHYGTNTKIGDLLYAAQRESFEDKDKGIRVTELVAKYLLNPTTERGRDFPKLGPNMLSSHYAEARYMMQRVTSTRADIICYREDKALAKSSSEKVSPLRKSPPESGYGTTLIEEDMTTFGKLSVKAQQLQKKLEDSMLTTPVGRKVGQLRTKTQQRLYTQVEKKFETTKSGVLQQFEEITKHHGSDEKTIERAANECVAIIGECDARLHNALNAVVERSTRQTSDKSRPGQLKLLGEEEGSYVSPARLLRHKGAAG